MNANHCFEFWHLQQVVLEPVGDSRPASAKKQKQTTADQLYGTLKNFRPFNLSVTLHPCFECRK